MTIKQRKEKRINQKDLQTVTITKVSWLKI